MVVKEHWYVRLGQTSVMARMTGGGDLTEMAMENVLFVSASRALDRFESKSLLIQLIPHANPLHASLFLPAPPLPLYVTNLLVKYKKSW